MKTGSQGVIYYATNKESYVNQAIMAARSVKETSPGMEVALFTNLEEYAQHAGQDCFDHIIPMTPHTENPELLFLDKLLAIQASPFAQTLYLDADTYVFQDLNPLFQLLTRFQVVVTHGHKRHIRDLAARGQVEDHKGRHRAILDDNFPATFPPIQGGFLLYRTADEAVKNWITTLIETYRTDDFYDDQVSMRKTLWENKELSLYALPEEYNFTGLKTFKRWVQSGFTIARPYILHYTDHTENPATAIKAIKKNTAYKPNPSLITKIKRKLKR